MKLTSSLNPELCLSTAPLPHADINITLQVRRMRVVAGRCFSCEPNGRDLNLILLCLCTTQIWAKPLASGATAVVALNRGLFAANVTFDLKTLGVPPARYSVRDLWANKSLGAFSDTLEVEVQSHDVVMVVMSPDN